MLRGQAEGGGGTIEIARTELYFAEAVGGRTEKFAAVELREQLTVSRGRIGISLCGAQAFAEPEQPGLSVDAARGQGEELLIFGHGEIVHLLAVESVGLLESATRGVVRQIGRRRADGPGTIRCINLRYGSRRASGCHGFRAAHLGRGLTGDRFGDAHLDALLCAKQKGKEQERDEEARHDSGRPVAKATFQMLAVRQTSNTATMCR